MAKIKARGKNSLLHTKYKNSPLKGQGYSYILKTNRKKFCYLIYRIIKVGHSNICRFNLPKTASVEQCCVTQDRHAACMNKQLMLNFLLSYLHKTNT